MMLQCYATKCTKKKKTKNVSAIFGLKNCQTINVAYHKSSRRSGAHISNKKNSTAVVFYQILAPHISRDTIIFTSKYNVFALLSAMNIKRTGILWSEVLTLICPLQYVAVALQSVWIYQKEIDLITLECAAIVACHSIIASNRRSQAQKAIKKGLVQFC